MPNEEMMYRKNADGSYSQFMQLRDVNGNSPSYTGDGKMKVDAAITVGDVTVTDITIKDAANASQKLKVNADGSINANGTMQLSGRSVVEEILINAVAHTDTTGGTANMPNLGNYREYEIFIVNTHDQPVRITLRSGTGSTGLRIVNADGTLTAYTAASVHHLIPAGTSARVPLSLIGVTGATNAKDIAQWKRYKKNNAINIQYSFGVAPTSGSITISLEGVPN